MRMIFLRALSKPAASSSLSFPLWACSREPGYGMCGKPPALSSLRHQRDLMDFLFVEFKGTALLILERLPVVTLGLCHDSIKSKDFCSVGRKNDQAFLLRGFFKAIWSKSPSKGRVRVCYITLCIASADTCLAQRRCAIDICWLQGYFARKRLGMFYVISLFGFAHPHQNYSQESLLSPPPPPAWVIKSSSAQYPTRHCCNILHSHTCHGVLSIYACLSTPTHVLGLVSVFPTALFSVLRIVLGP